MSRSVLEYLRHIQDEAEYLQRESQNLNFKEFTEDETLKRAFVRSIEIIGEAAKKVPENIRQIYQQIEWREISGMRDHLVHGYFAVDYEIVWNVVEREIPQLIQNIRQIITKISSENQ